MFRKDWLELVTGGTGAIRPWPKRALQYMAASEQLEQGSPKKHCTPTAVKDQIHHHPPQYMAVSGQVAGNKRTLVLKVSKWQQHTWWPPQIVNSFTKPKKNYMTLENTNLVWHQNTLLYSRTVGDKRTQWEVPSDSGSANSLSHPIPSHPIHPATVAVPMSWEARCPRGDTAAAAVRPVCQEWGRWDCVQSTHLVNQYIWEIHFEKYILRNTFWEIHFEQPVCQEWGR